MKHVVGFKIIRRKGFWPFILWLILPKKVPVEAVTRSGRTEYYDAKIDLFYALKFRNIRFVYSYSGAYLQMVRFRG